MTRHTASCPTVRISTAFLKGALRSGEMRKTEEWEAVGGVGGCSTAASHSFFFMCEREYKIEKKNRKVCVREKKPRLHVALVVENYFFEFNDA